MPPWITALLALLLISALGAYIVYGAEGFITAETACKTTFNACAAACSSSNGMCLKECGDAQTKCLSDAVAAATVANTASLNGPYRDANLAWAASLGSGALGNGSNDSSNGYMQWKNSAGSSTSISVYGTDVSRVYRPTGWDSSLWGGSNLWGSSPSSTTSSTKPSKTPTPASDWDGNRNTYTTGWRHPTFDLQDDASYDANAPVEGSYIVNVKRWKPHETPTQEAPGVTVDAPTDAGTQADTLKNTIPSLTQNIRNDIPLLDDIVPESLQQLIRDDVKDTMDALFRNQYEIKYS